MASPLRAQSLSPRPLQPAVLFNPRPLHSTLSSSARCIPLSSWLFSPLSSSARCPLQIAVLASARVHFRPSCPLPPELSSSARAVLLLAILFSPVSSSARRPLQPGVLFSPLSSSARAHLLSPRPLLSWSPIEADEPSGRGASVTEERVASMSGRARCLCTCTCRKFRNLSPPRRSDIAMVARYILGRPNNPEVLEIYPPSKTSFRVWAYTFPEFTSRM